MTGTAKYTKVGNKVTANFHLLLSNKGSITTQEVSGLPFAVIRLIIK